MTRPACPSHPPEGRFTPATSETSVFFADSNDGIITSFTRESKVLSEVVLIRVSLGSKAERLAISWHLWGWGLLLALSMAACMREAPPDEHDRILTTADGVSITVGDFETSYVAFLISTGQNDTPANRYLHLAALTDASLLADEAARRDYGADSAFRSIVERARRQAVGGRFFETTFLETLPPIDDAEVRRAFVRSKQQVVVRHLFYRDPAEAEAAHARLLAGRDFLEEAAVCYNLSTVDSSAGMLGPIRYFQVDDAFAEAAFALDVGEISEPVRSRYGYHIIRAEEKLGTPIVMESEYLNRKEGITTQVALRTRRLEGDRFVRTFMEELDVQVDAPAVLSLAQAIRRLENRVAPGPVELNMAPETVQPDLRALHGELMPDTPLATYTFEGETIVFTAGDYHFWLSELPFSEARTRTSASVGRALRNDALFGAGLRHGLDNDPWVAAEVERKSRRELTRRIRDTLRANPPTAIPETDLRAAFDRSPVSRQRRWIADFWTISFAAQSEAEAAQVLLTSDPSRAPDYAHYVRYTEASLDTLPQWAVAVRQAPVRQAMLARQASGAWALVRVEKRRAEPATTYAAARDSLLRAVAPRYNEYRLLRRLYDQATVTTDSLLFDRIMTLDGE